MLLINKLGCQRHLLSLIVTHRKTIALIACFAQYKIFVQKSLHRIGKFITFVQN